MSACFCLWSPKKGQRFAALVLAVFAMIVLMAMRRRAGLIAGETGLFALGLFLLMKNWRRFVVIAPVVALIGAAYIGVFWSSHTSIGEPARAIRSVFDSSSLSARDKASDDYRKAENADSWWNIRSSPLFGIGFGIAYAKPIPLVDSSSYWPFFPFTPHNTVLWVWMKAGIGACLFLWLAIGLAVARWLNESKATNDVLLLVTVYSFGAFVAMVVLFSYVDLGLTSTRLQLVWGCSLGLISVIRRLSAQNAVVSAVE
jgi:hypothetical protein